MSQFSVEDRMAWARKRTTTRREDSVYSILGIFDVQMPLLYGEGEKRALTRLHREIRDLSGKTFSPTTNDRRLARDEWLQNLHQWLSPPDPSVNYQKALAQRQQDTGLWLLDGEHYKNWKTSVASVLWLHGIPGCGKTILSSTILQDLLHYHDSHPDNPVVYFYFDFNDVQKQNAELMLCSLVLQLARQVDDSYSRVNTFYSSHGGGTTQPSLSTLLEMMRRIMEQSPPVYIMLDALDECSHRDDLMRIIETVAGWGLQNMHLIVTSRCERDIESSLVDLVDPHNIICLQSEVVDKDIQQYVRQRLSDDKGLNKWGRDVALRQEIENALLKGSKGMYVFRIVDVSLRLTAVLGFDGLCAS